MYKKPKAILNLCHRNCVFKHDTKTYLVALFVGTSINSAELARTLGQLMVIS